LFDAHKPIKAPGVLHDWDGFFLWFIDYVDAHAECLADAKVKRWYKVAIKALKVRKRENC
jgi:hypothetical protein